MKKQCGKCCHWNDCENDDDYTRCYHHHRTFRDHDYVCDSFKPKFQVKQLEFNVFNAAHTIVGCFRLLDDIWYQGDFRYQFEYLEGDNVEVKLFTGYSTLQEAKAAAQQHYEQLIMECIE